MKYEVKEQPIFAGFQNPSADSVTQCFRTDMLKVKLKYVAERCVNDQKATELVISNNYALVLQLATYLRAKSPAYPLVAQNLFYSEFVYLTGLEKARYDQICAENPLLNDKDIG